MSQQNVYGLDIEIEPSDRAGSPDPQRARIGRAALSTDTGEFVFDGAERTLLTDLDTALGSLAPGILATWNGAVFDLPYLADRAALCDLRIGLHLAADPRLRFRGEHLARHAHAYRAAWYEHRHLDAARLFASGRRPLVDVDELLRALGLHGWRSRTEGPADAPGKELTHEAAHAFATTDARLVRTMVEGRMPTALRQVDRITIEQPNPAPHPVRLRTRNGVPLSPAHPAVRAMLAGHG